MFFQSKKAEEPVRPPDGDVDVDVDEDEDEDEDPFSYQRLVNKYGCGELFEKVQACVDIHQQNYSKCQKELSDFRKCFMDGSAQDNKS